jgi:putative membrane protein
MLMSSHDFLHVWGWMAVVVTYLLWALLVFGVGWGMAYRLRSRHPRQGHEPAPEDPFEILKRRYAKGELTKEQFEQMKNDIKD